LIEVTVKVSAQISVFKRIFLGGTGVAQKALRLEKPIKDGQWTG
jgi:hypothetical protein